MKEKQFLNYLDGKLSTKEVKQFERELILNPDNLNLLSSLSSMKRELSSSEKVLQFLEEKTAKFHKMLNAKFGT